MTCFEIAAKVYRADAPHLSDALATLYGSPTRLRCRDGHRQTRVELRRETTTGLRCAAYV